MQGEVTTTVLPLEYLLTAKVLIRIYQDHQDQYVSMILLQRNEQIDA